MRLGEVKRYEKYKDSGVEWIGEVPEGWKVFRLKYTLQAGRNGIRIGPFGSSLKLEEMGENFSYKVYGQENLINNDFSIGQRYINLDKFLEMKEYEIFPNDIVISMMGTIGKCKIVPDNITQGIMDSHLVRIRTNNRIVPRFLALLIDESNYVKIQLELESKGSIMSGLNSTIIKELKLILPDVDCQRRILDFLDQKTSEIDSLIADKEKLIALLQEQRQAIISEAVTKGLDRNVKMKDSGIEWIGEVPEHWEVSRIKHVFSLVRDGTHTPPERCDEGYPLLSVRNIIDDQLVNLPDDSLISETDYNFLKRSFEVKENDILLAIVGATIGKVAIVGKMGPFTIQRSLAILRPKQNTLYYKFAFMFIRSNPFQKLLWSNVGFSAQPGIYLGALADFVITLPPFQEQIDIVRYLDHKIDSINSVLQDVRQQIYELKEYRKSIISEAVTGKIMV